MILREIVTKLGFQIDQRKIADWHNAITKIKASITSLSVHTDIAKKSMYALVGAATGLTLLSLHTAKSARTTEQLADKLGITAQELQSIELAAQSTGLGVNELSDSMNAFHKKLGDVGQGNTEASREMMRLGVVFTGVNGKIKSSFQLYEELAQKIDSIKSPIAKAAALQRVLGTDNIELAKLFANGGEALKKQREEIEKMSYIIDSKGLKSSKQFLKSWSEFQIIISGVKRELSVKFMPVFNNMVQAFKGWFIENRKLISQNISGFINVLSSAFGILFKAINLIITPISYVIDKMGGLENASRVLGVALGITLLPKIWATTAAFLRLTVVILANPITWITIAVGALALAIGLLVDDLWGWAHGSESTIAYVLYEWLGFEGSFKDIVDSVTGYFRQKFEALGEWFSGFFDGILNTISKATNFIKGVHNHAVNHAENTTSNSSSIPKIFPQLSSGVSSYIDRPLINPTSSTSGIVASNPYNPGGKVNQYITENITVNVPQGTTGEQAQAISIQIAQEMQSQISFNMQRVIDSLSSR